MSEPTRLQVPLYSPLACLACIQPALPLCQPTLEYPSEHTVLCDRVFHSTQHPSQMSMSFSLDISQPLPKRYNLGPMCSLQMQGSPAGPVNGTVQPIQWFLVLKMPALGTFLRLHSPRAITLALQILDIVSICHCSTFASHLIRYSHLSFPALKPTYQPHPHHPVPTTSSKPPPSSILLFPHRPPSIAFDAVYLGHNPPSIQHHIQVSPQVPNNLGLPYPSPELPYHPHHRLPAPAPALALAPAQSGQLLLPQSAGLCMHTLCRTYPVLAVAATQTLTSFLSQPSVFGSSHCNSSVSAFYNEVGAYGVPHFEPDSIHWNSPPTSSTRSGLPVTPPDHTTTGDEEQFVDTQASLKAESRLNEGTKDVFQSLKRKRLPVAASFSRPKPRALPVKKVLPKIHGCPTCGKMFDRPSTLLVVSTVLRFSVN